MISSFHDHILADHLDQYLDQFSASSGPFVLPGSDEESGLFRVAATVLSTAPRSDPAALDRLRARVFFPERGTSASVSGQAPVTASSPSFDTQASTPPRWLKLAAALIILLAGVAGSLALSGRTPFGPGGGDKPTLIPAAVPPTDGGQAVAPPVPTLVQTPIATAIIVPTQAPAMLEQPYQAAIRMRDIFFDPSIITVPAGVPVELLLVNEGDAPHTFVVEGLDEPVPVEVGGWKVVSLVLEPGVYEFVCTIPGHAEAGMVGEIIAEEQDDPNTGSISADTMPAEFQLELLDIRFDPVELRIPALVSSVVELVNLGAAPHNFSVPDLNISVDVPPGQTRRVAITPPAGSFAMYCNIVGHREAGMTGTLVAT